MDKRNKYSPHQDYLDMASKSQSVLSENEAIDKLLNEAKEITPANIEEKRLSQVYSCNDNYQMGTIKDNHIYVAMTDNQHQQLVNKEIINSDGGISGCFSDQATIDACKNNDGTLNNTKYNEMCQIAPYREGGLIGQGDATYKPHIECLEINRDKLQEIYGTRDFNAAIAKCEANNQFGAGGGNQGFNPHINELIQNGCLVHKKDASFSDLSISKSEYNNSQTLSNSVVNELDYRDMMNDAKIRSQDCVKNNTSHPSAEACKNGFEHNANPIQSPTGNATEWNKGQATSSEQRDSVGVRAGPHLNGHNSEVSCPKTDELAKFPLAQENFSVPDKGLASKNELAKESKNAIQPAHEMGTSLNLSNNSGLNT